MALRNSIEYIKWFFFIGYFEECVNWKSDYLELLLSVYITSLAFVLTSGFQGSINMGIVWLCFTVLSSLATLGFLVFNFKFQLSISGWDQQTWTRQISMYGIQTDELSVTPTGIRRSLLTRIHGETRKIALTCTAVWTSNGTMATVKQSTITSAKS